MMALAVNWEEVMVRIGPSAHALLAVRYTTLSETPLPMVYEPEMTGVYLTETEKLEPENTHTPAGEWRGGVEEVCGVGAALFSPALPRLTPARPKPH